MKKSIHIVVLFFLAILCYDCEKDDICTQQTTGLVGINFLDAANPAVARAVPLLKIVEQRKTADTLSFTNVTAIRLPLRTNQEQTVYHFILKETDSNEILSNNTVQFNYTAQDLYVSRACGFKTEFELTTVNDLTDAEWIEEIQVIQNNITSQNEIHVKIFF